jgi:hypothetical protein
MGDKVDPFAVQPFFGEVRFGSLIAFRHYTGDKRDRNAKTRHGAVVLTFVRMGSAYGREYYGRGLKNIVSKQVLDELPDKAALPRLLVLPLRDSSPAAGCSIDFDNPPPLLEDVDVADVLYIFPREQSGTWVVPTRESGRSRKMVKHYIPGEDGQLAQVQVYDPTQDTRLIARLLQEDIISRVVQFVDSAVPVPRRAGSFNDFLAWVREQASGDMCRQLDVLMEVRASMNHVLPVDRNLPGAMREGGSSSASASESAGGATSTTSSGRKLRVAAINALSSFKGAESPSPPAKNSALIAQALSAGKTLTKGGRSSRGGTKSGPGRGRSAGRRGKSSGKKSTSTSKGDKSDSEMDKDEDDEELPESSPDSGDEEKESPHHVAARQLFLKLSDLSVPECKAPLASAVYMQVVENDQVLHESRWFSWQSWFWKHLHRVDEQLYQYILHTASTDAKIEDICAELLKNKWRGAYAEFSRGTADLLWSYALAEKPPIDPRTIKKSVLEMASGDDDWYGVKKKGKRSV